MFETLLVVDGRLQAPELHLKRLATAVEDLYGASLPGELAQRLRTAAAKLNGTHRLRVHARPRGGAVAVRLETQSLDLSGSHHPVRLKPVLLPGGLGPYKWWDRRLVERSTDGRSVPLLVDADGDVLEAAWANFWIIEARHIVTPPADGRLLPGVTRALLLELAETLGLIASTEAISLTRARQADSTFLTSSLRHAVPAMLDDDAPPGRRDPTVEIIRGALGSTCWSSAAA